MNKDRYNKFFSVEKENFTIHTNKDHNNTRKQAPCKSSARNPLSTLCDNIPLPQNSVQKSSKAFKKSSSSTRKHVRRSHSTSELEKKLNLPPKTVTVRSGKGDSGNKEDEVFVDGEVHYINYLPDRKKCSEFHEKVRHQEQELKIEPTVPVVRVSGRCEDLTRKPARKTTLVRKLSGRYSRHKSENFYAESLYNEEYVVDNYKYMLQTEGKFVFRKSYLKKYIHFGYRLAVVNWLVYMQQVLELTETTIFITVRMFDYFLVKNQISSDKYVLMAVTCMWITSKIYDTRRILVPKLFALCNGKFSRNQIISAEKEILTSLNFTMNYPDPLIFLYYYLKGENLETNMKIRLGAMFLLETFTLSLEFSSSSPSLLAASAVYLILCKNDIKCDTFLKTINDDLVEEHIFKQFAKQLSDCVQEILKFKAFDNEVVGKYSAEEKLNVAQFFISD